MTRRGHCQPQPFCDSSNGRILLNFDNSVNWDTVTSFSDLVETRVSKEQLGLLLTVFHKADLFSFLILRIGALSQSQAVTTDTVQTY